MDSISPAGFHRIKAAMKSYFEKEESYKKRFMILSGRKIKKVDTSEIAYFYSLEKKVFIVTYQDKVFPVDYSLEELGDLLNPVEFFRINRKMLIAFKSIGNMTPYPRSRIKIDLIPPEPDDAEAVVSVDRISAFRDWLNQ
jgi:DNA-binding LytR/AlgR family response regulator